jgi:hypothetical protein
MGTPRFELSDTQADFLTGPRSIVVAAFDRACRAAMARGLACKLSADRKSVTLVLHPQHAAGLLDAIRDSGRFAAVFSDPSTHHSLQLKSEAARPLKLPAAELETLAAGHLARFSATVVALGFNADVVRALLRGVPGPLVAVRGSVAEAFEQTPGPNAGARLT